MGSFKDTNGRDWQVSVTGGTIKRVLDLLKIDIGDPLSPGTQKEVAVAAEEVAKGTKPSDRKPFQPILTRFDTDIAFKVDLLYAVLKPQLDRAEVSDTDFAELLGPDALYSASEAFDEAWTSFFRSLHRPHLVAAVEKQREQIQRIWAAAAKLVESDAMAAKLEGDLEALGSSFANSLQSPEPTPNREHSES